MVHTGFPSSDLCNSGSSDPFFSPLCVRLLPRSCRGVSALSSPPPRLFLAITTVCLHACPEPQRKRSEGSAFLGSSLATHHSPLATIPFRIISFAHPHRLTLTESYSYKKQGRGVGAPASRSNPSPEHMRNAQQHPQPQSFHAFTSRFSGYPGGGASVFLGATPCTLRLCVILFDDSLRRFA
jgi:hypothetical protein